MYVMLHLFNHFWSVSMLLYSPDFGLERLIELVDRTSFPWLMSNVLDNETGRPLADGKLTHTIVWQGWKIGLVCTSQFDIVKLPDFIVLLNYYLDCDLN